MPSTVEPPQGFASGTTDPLRYDGQQLEPEESPAMVVESIPVGARVLDVGCGTGSISVMLRDLRKADLLGIEPSAERVEVARNRGLNVIHGLFTAESVKDLGLFDVVVFADVLEHLSDPADAIAVARSVLKPGGLIVTSVPNIAHWSVRLDLLRGRFEYRDLGIMDATHLRWFTRDSLTRMFTRLDFEVVSIRSSAGLWLSDYRNRRPWVWIAKETRRRIVLGALSRWPGLFACQYIVVARPKS